MKISIVQFVSTLPNFQVSGLCEQLGGRILPFIFFFSESHLCLYSHTSCSRSCLVFLGEWKNTSLKK